MHVKGVRDSYTQAGVSKCLVALGAAVSSSVDTHSRQGACCNPVSVRWCNVGATSQKAAAVHQDALHPGLLHGCCPLHHHSY